MKKFSIELLNGNLPDYLKTYVAEVEPKHVELTMNATITINSIPLIQDDGTPEITLFIPGDFNWMLDVIEKGDETLCLTDFGSVIYFRIKGDFYSITLSGKLRKGQVPIKDVLVPRKEVEREVLGAINKFIKMARENNPKVLEALNLKQLATRAESLAARINKKNRHDVQNQ